MPWHAYGAKTKCCIDDGAVAVDLLTHERGPPGFRRNNFGRRLVIGSSCMNRYDLLSYGPYTALIGCTQIHPNPRSLGGIEVCAAKQALHVGLVASIPVTST